MLLVGAVLADAVATPTRWTISCPSILEAIRGAETTFKLLLGTVITGRRHGKTRKKYLLMYRRGGTGLRSYYGIRRLS